MHFLKEPQKASGICDWPTLLKYQDIAKNYLKGQFAQNLKNGSDIYEYVLQLNLKVH